MKSRLFIYMLSFAGLITQFSCKKFLDQDPKTALTQEQVFSKLSNIEPVIGGLYIKWRDTRKDRGGFIFQLGGDEAQQGAFQVNTDADQSGLDKYNGFLAPRNNAITGQWDARWPIVNTAAQAVYGLQNNKEDTVKANILQGEARFIRAALTFELAQYWGEIPIIDQARQNELGRRRQPLDKVYSFIIQDLQFAAAHLPETQSDKKRATRYAAIALLGKVYMYAPQESSFRDFQKAAQQFNTIISSGKYSLAANFADLYDYTKPNGPESIYEFQFINVYPDNNQIQWQMGSRALANIDEYCYFGGYDLMVPTKYCYSDVSQGGIWEPGDVRKNQSIRYNFTYRMSNGRDTVPKLPPGFGGDELDPHVKKFEDPRTQGNNSFWNSGKDVFYLRYADILLCYAECLNELQRTAEGVNYVNQVRTRAFGGSLPQNMQWSPGMSQADFRTKILDERMRELCFEGWRRMDLIRTGKLVELVKARNKWAAQSNTIQTFHNRYPIPLTEILQNPDIPASAQNAGYQ